MEKEITIVSPDDPSIKEIIRISRLDSSYLLDKETNMLHEDVPHFNAFVDYFCEVSGSSREDILFFLHEDLTEEGRELINEKLKSIIPNRRGGIMAPTIGKIDDKIVITPNEKLHLSGYGLLPRENELVQLFLTREVFERYMQLYKGTGTLIREVLVAQSLQDVMLKNNLWPCILPYLREDCALVFEYSHRLVIDEAVADLLPQSFSDLTFFHVDEVEISSETFLARADKNSYILFAHIKELRIASRKCIENLHVRQISIADVDTLIIGDEVITDRKAYFYDFCMERKIRLRLDDDDILRYF